MNFNNEKPIYLQMSERLMDEIAAGIYPDEERIPSVREYAVSLGVNTNTAMKAYDELSRNNIIYNKRGLGYFVTQGANENIKSQRRRDFMEHGIQQLVRQMKLIDMDVDELTKLLKAQTADEK